jgi:hypothetical protein
MPFVSPCESRGLRLRNVKGSYTLLAGCSLFRPKSFSARALKPGWDIGKIFYTPRGARARADVPLPGRIDPLPAYAPAPTRDAHVPARTHAHPRPPPRTRTDAQGGEAPSTSAPVWGNGPLTKSAKHLSRWRSRIESDRGREAEAAVEEGGSFTARAKGPREPEATQAPRHISSAAHDHVHP